MIFSDEGCRMRTCYSGEAMKDVSFYCYFDSPIFSETPILIGTIRAISLEGRGMRYRFHYDSSWSDSKIQLTLHPDSEDVYSDTHIPTSFLNDNLPDRWGRTLIERKMARMRKQPNSLSPFCSELDYLISSDDFTRKGAIRIADTDGNWIAQSEPQVPPISSLVDYTYVIEDYEKNGVRSQLFEAFYSSSSSLGGARPKLNVKDSNGNLWIAKVPSVKDDYDVGAWENLILTLASKAGISVSENMVVEHPNGKHSLLSKRFDRQGEERIHTASMASFIRTKSDDSSFIDIAEVISQISADLKEDLKELYRRVVFSAAVNNTDNHLHNHSMILTKSGWRLSPTYDINPCFSSDMSVLAVDFGVKTLSPSVIFETAPWYEITKREAKQIFKDVFDSVVSWKNEAGSLGMSKEIPLLEPAFFHLGEIEEIIRKTI